MIVTRPPAPRTSPRCLIGAGLVALTALLSPKPAAAAETETRTFDVSVSGDKVGTSKLVITKQDDGSLLVKNEADIKVQILWVKINYWLREYEIWKNGTLQRLEANTYDDGDKRAVDVTAQGPTLLVKVNGKEKTIAAPVWTTTYFRLPAPDARGESQHLLDSDSGRDFNGKFTFVGKEACSAAGRATTCSHYRMKTNEEVDLWFDETDKLVRRETTKMGKRVAIALTSVK